MSFMEIVREKDHESGIFVTIDSEFRFLQLHFCDNTWGFIENKFME